MSWTDKDRAELARKMEMPDEHAPVRMEGTRLVLDMRSAAEGEMVLAAIREERARGARSDAQALESVLANQQHADWKKLPARERMIARFPVHHRAHLERYSDGEIRQIIAHAEKLERGRR